MRAKLSTARSGAQVVDTEWLNDSNSWLIARVS
jgi:hypothetical protein